MGEQAHGWIGDLAAQYGAMVFAVAWRLTGNPDDAEDAAQEVFLKLLRRGEPAGGARDWGAYLKTMATTAGLDVLRRRGRRGGVAMTIDWIENLPGPDRDDPRAVAERRQMAALLRAMLERLPPREASIFSLRYFDELSYDAIATQLGLTTSQVGVTLHRTRHKLLEMLKPLLDGAATETDHARA